MYKTIEVDDEKAESTHWIDSTRSNVLIGGVIVLNAICIGLETDFGSREPGINNRLGWYIIEFIFCLIFFLEVFFRMKVHRVKFFFSMWNLFDFFIVGSLSWRRGFSRRWTLVVEIY